MRNVLLSLGIAAIAIGAVPAGAQSYRYDGYDRGFDRGYNCQYRSGASQDLWRLSQQVDRAIQRGDLNRRETDYFRREIAQLRYLDQRLGYGGGNNGRGREQLDRRIDRLRGQLRDERRDDDRRWDRRDRW